MTRPARRVAEAWDLARAEGLTALGNRMLDHLAETRRRRAFVPGVAGAQPEGLIPVLNLSSTPPSPWLGGVPTQLRVRLSSEALERPVALLYPDGGGWLLELESGGEKRAWRLGGSGFPTLALADAAFETMLVTALELTGAQALHVEGLSGLPLESLLRVQRRGLRLLVSLHDFAGFCPRPHLLEQPFQRFCEYSRDPGRCRSCLRQDWQVPEDYQARHRELAAGLLELAEVVVHPSEFLRRTYLDLYPSLAANKHRVVVPGTSQGAAGGDEWRSRQVRHVAFVGSVKAHKGAGVFEELVERWRGRGEVHRLQWSVYGGGDADLLRRLHRLPEVRVRGYYRVGTLPRLLRRDHVDLALLLSIIPESHSLVLSECRAAGVPCLAFDLGAVGERVRREGGGLLVPLARGAQGIDGPLHDVIERRAQIPPLLPLPPPQPASRAMLDLYRELGLLPGMY